jgi:hypothetical protein
LGEDRKSLDYDAMSEKWHYRKSALLFDHLVGAVAHRVNAQHEDGQGSLGCPQFVGVLTARAAQGFALPGAFEAIPVVTGGKLIISRLFFTRFVLIKAHTKKIDANKHMTANKPV